MKQFNLRSSKLTNLSHPNPLASKRNRTLEIFCSFSWLALISVDGNIQILKHYQSNCVQIIIWYDTYWVFFILVWCVLERSMLSGFFFWEVHGRVADYCTVQILQWLDSPWQTPLQRFNQNTGLHWVAPAAKSSSRKWQSCDLWTWVEFLCGEASMTLLGPQLHRRGNLFKLSWSMEWFSDGGVSGRTLVLFFHLVVTSQIYSSAVSSSQMKLKNPSQTLFCVW